MRAAFPAGDDFDRWVALLGDAPRSTRAYHHLLLSGRAALPAITSGLVAPGPEVRRRCVLLLDHLAVDESMPLLITMLDDAEPAVRRDTLHALSCDRCKEDGCSVVPLAALDRALVLMRDDPDPHVRAAACELVARWVHTDERATRALAEAHADDPSSAVRKKAGWYVPNGTIFERTRPR